MAQKAVNLPNARILFDIYHMQTMGGNIVAFLRQNMDRISYLHVAGVPDRHGPQESGLNSPFILREVDRMSFRGKSEEVVPGRAVVGVPLDEVLPREE